ncbi:MAG: hypothetical protein ACXWUP_13460 [Allosphingosinicella sp.]
MSWPFRTCPWFEGELFVPEYRPIVQGDWELRIMALGMAPGYWSAPAMTAGMPALIRRGETWMSITPLEYESQQIGIRAAHGHVLIFGLGLGWAAAATAALPDVDAVTVIENDPDVLAMHRALDPFAQLPRAARAKLRLIEGDAFRYRPVARVDLLMPDIWYPLVSDGRLDEVRRMQDHVGARAIYFWGQELEPARHAVAAGRQLDASGIAATTAATGLPLIGPDTPDYADRLVAAARRWMRDRWLPGSIPPFDERGHEA